MATRIKGKVLITRPEGDAKRLGDLITSKNYEVVYAPFLNVVLHGDNVGALEGYSGLIFTSRNGVRAYCKNTSKRDLPVFTVGDSTRQLAREQGFKDVQSAQGDVSSLEDIIPKGKGGKPYLHIRGKHVTRELNTNNIVSKVLYHTDIIDEVGGDVSEIMGTGGITHVVFFSTRTADAFVAYVQKNKICEGLKQTQALCLGASMVKSVSVLPWISVEVALRPEAISVIDLLD